MLTCPFCEAQLPDDAAECPECGKKIKHKHSDDPTAGAPGNEKYSIQMGDWPVDGNGEKEGPALLTEMNNVNMQLDALRGLLLGAGIPTFVTPIPTAGVEIAQIYFGQIWQNRYAFEVFVPESRLEEARAILEAPPVWDEAELNGEENS